VEVRAIKGVKKGEENKEIRLNFSAITLYELKGYYLIS
jgi:hypothetical protein